MYPTRGANSSTCVVVKSRPKKWLMLGFPNNVLLKTLQDELYVANICQILFESCPDFSPQWWKQQRGQVVTHRLSAPPHYLIICSSLSHYLLLSWKRLSAPQLKKIICSSAEKDYLLLSWKKDYPQVLSWKIIEKESCSRRALLAAAARLAQWWLITSRPSLILLAS